MAVRTSLGPWMLGGTLLLLAGIGPGCGSEPTRARTSAARQDAPRAAPTATAEIAPAGAEAAEPALSPCSVDVDPDALLVCEKTTRAEPQRAANHASTAGRARAAGELARCTEEYALAYEADPANDRAASWALSSLECRLELWQAARRGLGGATAAPDAPAPSKSGPVLERAARRVACIDPPRRERPRALYWIARLRSRAGRWTEAAILFDAVVREGRDTEVAGYAALLALEALNQEARESPEVAGACRLRIGELADRYRQALCTNADRARWRDECEILTRVQARTP